jgi:TonB-linked SusC/RagA family outer membrane protein
MKKFRDYCERNSLGFFSKKTIRVMRLTLFLSILTISQLWATETYSQMAKITLKLEDVKISDALKEIENQSEFYFLYSPKLIDVERKVNIDATKEPIKDILSKIFDEKVKFVVYDRQIILTQSDVKSLSSSMQQLKITGTVTDENGTPLTGVNVQVEGTTIGTITDIKGKYSIEKPNDNVVLIFSFIGYASQKASASGKTFVDISMVPETKTLEEVVVVGYGTQKKVSITGSVATVRSEQLTVAPVANVTNTLAGRLTGLITKQESGKPGADNSALNIRGFGSPLVIVDGIEASFNTLDANEIESITILKDASASIYGSRAGNGVLLVTTKRGNTGKPTIEINSNWTLQGVTNMPRMASSGQRAELIREAWLNAGNPESTCRFTQQDVDLFYAGTNPDYPNTNWDKIVLNNWSPEIQNNLSIRGGNDKIKYYGFLGYLNQKSMFKPNGGEYDRYNLQSNIDAKITDNLFLQLDLSGIVEKSRFPRRDQNSDIWQDYWGTEPFWSPTLPNGNLAYGGAGAAAGVHFMSNKDLCGFNNVDISDLKGTLSLKYDFSQIKGLTAKAFANYHPKYTFSKYFSKATPDSWSYNYSNDTYTQWSSSTQPVLVHQDNREQVLTGQFSLSFDRTLASKHHISGLALYEIMNNYSDLIKAERDGYIVKSLPYLFAGAVDKQFSDGSASEMGRQSYIGRINYSYESKYLLESTLRVDESAKFDKEHRRGFFPGISIGWRLSEENFIKENVPALENLKLRASYSQAGNDNVGNFKYLSGYTYGSPPYIIGNSASTGLVTTGLENPLLTWEKMKTYNLGLDFGLTKRKLYGELDFFYRERDGIPGTKVASLPTTFGATLPTINLNSISTRGFDLMLGTQGQLSDLNWDVTANISWSRSKWEYYDEPDYTTADPDTKRLNKLTGRWTDVTFGYKSDGLFTSQDEIDALMFVYDETKGNPAVKPGTIRYVDTNKDGLLNWRDQVEIGKGTTPHWMSGLNINLNYKNFDLSALFQGAFGFYTNVKIRDYSILQYNDRWTDKNNNRDGLVPRLGVSYTGYTSDFYYKKADYLRLKTMSIGYNISNSLLSKINIEKFRIYIAGTNLLTFSGLNKYNIDPEAPSGMGGYYYPQMRTISFGFNLTF